MPLGHLSTIFLAVAAGAYAGSLLCHVLQRERGAEWWFAAGFILHTVSQVSRAWFIGILTPNAMLEGITFFPWCLALIAVGLRLARQNRALVSTTLAPILVFVFVALVYPKGIFPPSPLTGTLFAFLFFLFEVPAHACFAAGAWFAYLYLRRREPQGIFDSFILWGFLLYSVAQVVGAIWSYLGWAHLYMWNNRHMQSAAVWCCYAAYLHLRFMPAWDTRRKSWYAVAGFVLVLVFSYGGHFNEMRMPRLGG